jgi:hypothetical protein
MSVVLNTPEKTGRKTKLSISDKILTVKAILKMAFYLLFCYAFTIVVGGTVFSNNMNNYSPAIPLVFMVVEVASLLFIFYSLKKHDAFIAKIYPIIVSAGLILLFIVNIKLGYMLRFKPVFDLGAIFTAAKEWATTGNFMDHMDSSVSSDYFYHFPNNIGGMAFLFVAFKAASLFGVTDYFAIAMVANGLLATATVLLIVLICKRLFGITQSMIALMFVLLSPPFYMIAPVFYTDSLSMVFPVLILYFYLRLLDGKTVIHKIVFTVLIGLSCAIGMSIKFTVIIALIAILIHAILTKGIVPFLQIVAGAGAAITAFLLVFNIYFYSVHLDANKADELNIPFTHWFMMSLENGYYSPQDYDFTLSFTDKAEQQTAINARIKERVKEKGLFGMLNLFFWKNRVSFGDSTYGQSDFLDDEPVNKTKLHSVVLYDGRYFNRYKYVCSATYFTIQALILLSAYSVLLRKKKTYKNMIPLICIFGVMLFFMIWEVEGRYVTNFVPIMIVCAVSGFDILIGILQEKKIKFRDMLTEWKVSN